MLVQRVGEDGHFNPFAAACDDRQDRRPGISYPHVVLQLSHMLFRCAFFGEGPRQHEFGLENRARRLNKAIKGSSHPVDGSMLNPPLNVFDGVTGVSLIPAPIEVLCDGAELNN